MRYLDPVGVAKLQGLELRRRLAGAGSAGGRHRSLLRGRSQEFAEHRHYVPGDEVRSLDWKVYARQDRFFVKEHHPEDLLTAFILLDRSASMGFTGGGESKWELACRLSMALAYLALSQGDAAGLVTFDVEPRHDLPPKSGLAQLRLFDEALIRSSPSGKTGLSSVLERMAGRLRRRSLVVLISDLLGEPAEAVAVLKALRARRHEALVLQVLDPRERDFPFEGPVVFEGLEDGVRVQVDADAVGDAYREAFAKRQRLYEANFHRSEIPYLPFYTDVPWDVSLGRFLAGL